MVHTSMYQYMVVQHGTGQYENSSYVQGSMYQYIPVQAFNKTCDFPTNSERFRRDKIKVVQLLCIEYNLTMAIFKTTQVQLFQSTYWYILVHTGTYLYILVHHSKKLQTSFDHVQSSLRRLRVSADCLAWFFLPVCFLTAVSSTVRPPRRGLPRPKFHSQSSTTMYQYKYVYTVLACTGMYQYVLVPVLCFQTQGFL